MDGKDQRRDDSVGRCLLLIDRVKIGQRSSFFASKGIWLFGFGLLLAAILIFKGIDEGWFIPRTPLALDYKPAVLFFNRHKGCECALVVYRAAADQVQNWSEEDRQGVRLIQIDLDQRPDLGDQFGIIRAPTLLLVDGYGEIKYRQDEVVTDAEPLNLSMIEGKISEVVNGN